MDDTSAREATVVSSDYIPELIREVQDRQRLRSLLLDGTASSPTTAADAGYFDQLRDACLPGKAHAVGGGEAQWLGGECAPCVADGQPEVFRVDDAPDRPG